MIYGSGLRSGFANTETVPAYTQVNLGSHEFTFTNAKPLTLRFDVVNVFDTIYEIRSGSGIGVFAHNSVLVVGFSSNYRGNSDHVDFRDYRA